MKIGMIDKFQLISKLNIFRCIDIVSIIRIRIRVITLLQFHTLAFDAQNILSHNS